MNYLVQRGKVRGQVINVPEGLPELLSDITREVLRCQPTTECLCQFIIDYLHSVIITREKAMMAKKIIDRALRIVNEIISDMCICDITKQKNEDMAHLMEECFRNFLEKRRCERHKDKEIVKFQEEDMLDELIKKCKFSEQELLLSRPMIEAAYKRFVDAYMSAAEGTEGTEALYMYFKEREQKRKEEVRRNDAATRIQASFRGFRVRQEIAKRDTHAESTEEDITSDFEEKDHAARTLQKFFRMTHERIKSLASAALLKPECEPGSQIEFETGSILIPQHEEIAPQPSVATAKTDVSGEPSAAPSTQKEVEQEEKEPEEPPEAAEKPVEQEEEPEPVEATSAEEPPATDVPPEGNASDTEQQPNE